MGCTGSKLDDLPAVALCRQRCNFLDEAIHQRFSLAQAHAAYLNSLKGVGFSLHRFFDFDPKDVAFPSPLLNLPAKRKGDPQPSHIHHSHSNSGSHLHFHSDSDDGDSASGSLHHHGHDISPVNHLSYADRETETLGSFPGGFMNINYMKNTASQSVLYEQRPFSHETIHMDMAESSSSSHIPYNYNNNNNNYTNPSSNPYYGYSNYGGFFGSSSPPPRPVAEVAEAASSSKAPPPPPSPPRGSAWDFLNPFDTFDKFYPRYTPSSRDSKEVRDEEGIPDLEEEDYQQEIVKEVDGHQKFVDSGGGGRSNHNHNHSKAVVDDEGGKANEADLLFHNRPSVSSSSEDAVEYEVHMVDKKVVDKEEMSADKANGAASKATSGFRDDSQVVKEIKVQFERASESGNELAKMLEVGKLPHNRNHASYQVVSSNSKMYVANPSLPLVSSQPSTSKNAESSSIEKIDPAYLDANEDVEMRFGNLSSTLQQLYLWEKKLYEEVKVEEKMRILHERKCRRLKRLDEKGAESHKVDTTRSLVRSLSTKIRISIQVVDKICVKINKLRDEELWRQLNSFIQGLTRMWKSMLECHHIQCQAIVEARQLDAIASHKHSSDAPLEATLQLEHELANWTYSFSCWVRAQKDYVKALNNWLMKCLLYVPEETPDGIVPFSPGRIGAPPVFVICNQWSQALDRISEKEVVDSMRDFSMGVRTIILGQRIMGNKAMERKVKNLERDELKIHKQIQALDKRLVTVYGDDNGLSLNGQVVYQSDTSKSGGLQVSLQRIFEAMERFTASSLGAYEELLQRIDEDILAQEYEKVS